MGKVWSYHYIWSFQGRNQKRWAQATLRQWRQKHARILNILFCFVLLCLLLNLYFNCVKAELLGQLAVYVIQTKSDLVFLQILFCSQCYCSLCQITSFSQRSLTNNSVYQKNHSKYLKSLNHSKCLKSLSFQDNCLMFRLYCMIL